MMRQPNATRHHGCTYQFCIIFFQLAVSIHAYYATYKHESCAPIVLVG